jgi:N-acetylmuramoyl-L-alanine amidase
MAPPVDKVPEGYNHITLTSNGSYSVSRGVVDRRYTQQELILIAQLVQAEAGGEPYEGKVLVASVVMNRQAFGQYFGDTIHNVIHKRGQFDGIKRQCFADGTYTDEDIKAVRDAQRIANKYMFFCNLETSTDSDFINSLNWTLTVGNHSFSEGKQ